MQKSTKHNCTAQLMTVMKNQYSLYISSTVISLNIVYTWLTNTEIISWFNKNCATAILHIQFYKSMHTMLSYRHLVS